MTDQDIIALYFARSESAIQETNKKYGPYLNEVAYRILRSFSDTEEIVNDTYLGAWNAIPPSNPHVLKHFLSKITRNLAFSRLDYLLAKKRSNHMTSLLSELDECIPDQKNNVETIWEQHQIGDSINEYLRTLPEMDCAVFVSRYYYACTIAEISSRYGLTARQVKYILTKCRSGLKQQLEKDGVW